MAFKGGGFTRSGSTGSLPGCVSGFEAGRVTPGLWGASLVFAVAALFSHAVAAQPAQTGGDTETGFVALAAMVVAGLAGVALLAYGVARLRSAGRRAKPARGSRTRPTARPPFGAARSPSWADSSGPDDAARDAEAPSGSAARRHGSSARGAALHTANSHSIPRVTDEVTAPRTIAPHRPAVAPAAAAARSDATRNPPAPSRAPERPAEPHRDRVWSMLDEIRHVPLATRLAPIAGVAPRHRLAAADEETVPAALSLPSGAAKAAAPAARTPGAHPPPVAPVPTASASKLPAALAPAAPAAPAINPPIAAARAEPAAVAPAAAAPRPPVAMGAPRAAQDRPPPTEPGSSARWSDEKRAELRRAVDRLRASRDPHPQRRKGDALAAASSAGAVAQAAPPSVRAAAQAHSRAQRPAGVERRRADDTVSQPHEFQLSAADRGERARWIGPDEEVVVSGHAIAGMVYVGAASRYSGVESDPALIDDELDVSAPEATAAGSLDAANSSYASLEPAHRGAYLAWLAGGRSASAPASFALIFFMGLERRVIELLGRTDALPELNRLAAEMRRLVQTHGMDSFSLHHHATRLAALVDMQSTRERMYRRPVPVLHRTYDLPVELRLALGHAAFDQAPLPAAWALAWLLADQTFHLRSPMTRCPDEFRRLFDARYGERFGAGLRLPDAGRQLQLTYTPVSRSLASADGFHFAVDEALDVDAGCTAAAEMRALCSLCAEDLFEYSRYIGRHPAALASPDAQLRLPAAIRPAALKARIAELRLACQSGRPPANPHEAALALWGVGLADKDSAGLLQALLAAEDISTGSRPERGL
ncbi:MAG: hypothetical protein AD742_04995 [Methylibium sp. NZG]|nr:MAG: hypothetical protein AD742_04995 [Methylibium sp. NZG]